MLGQMRQSIQVLTLQQLLLKRNEFDTFIVDEAEECIFEQGHAIDPDSY